MAESGAVIVNLGTFRRALRQAADASPRELTNALKKAGAPIVKRAGELAPVGPTGRLSKSYTIRVAGVSAKLYSRVPYGVGAEWGLYGKWSGFTKYPAFGTGASAGRGRFAWRAVVERKDETAEIIVAEMQEILRLHGWARP